MILLEQEQLVIKARKGNVTLKTLPYSQMKTAEYSYSKSPRWKSGIGLAVAVGVFAIPLFFMKGKKHWLTIQAENDYAILHLDKGNFRVILPAFETRSRVKVETIGDEDQK